MTKRKQGSDNRRKRAEEWDAARVLFEREPTETYASIGVLMKCSKQRVGQVAAEMGWKKADNIQAIVGVAQKQADAKFAVNTEPDGGVRASTPADQPSPSDPKSHAEITADQKAADLRAAVLARHRTEWAVPRTLLQESILNKERDIGKAKLAKVVAETLKLSQDGERKAWGMDAGETPPGTPGAPGAPGTRLILIREAAPYAK